MFFVSNLNNKSTTNARFTLNRAFCVQPFTVCAKIHIHVPNFFIAYWDALKSKNRLSFPEIIHYLSILNNLKTTS